jgi:hypothetical protein
LPLAAGEGKQVMHLSGLLPLTLPAGEELALPLPALSAPVGRVEVRVLLPGGHRWTLADVTRSGTVRPPPSTAASADRRRSAVALNRIAQQIHQLPQTAAGGGALFARPSGFGELTAAWSAVSAAPPPLALVMRSQREETPWF